MHTKKPSLLTRSTATAETLHEAIDHSFDDTHHQHKHAARSQHEGGHHLLQIENLTIGFKSYDSSERASLLGSSKEYVQIIHDLHLSVHRGEILALLGASGSGKTLLADALMGLYEPNVRVEGKIWFDGVLQNRASLEALRGRGISLVPQSVTHLDPLMKVGKQLEGFPKKGSSHKKRARQRDALLKQYGLEASVKEKYPFELSGGMARRILLISALMDDAQVIIADEPTPGLNLELAVKALEDFRAFAHAGGGVLLITHDIELALKVANRVAVFKEGTVVEETSVAHFSSPATLQHPFSKQLWHALPEHDFTVPESTPEVLSGTLQRDKEAHT